MAMAKHPIRTAASIAHVGSILWTAGADGDRNGDGSGADGQREGEGIEGSAGDVGMGMDGLGGFGPSSSASSLRFRRDQPVAMTTSPPPTWTTGREMPKKARMLVPIRTERTRRTNPLTAIFQERTARSCAGGSAGEDQEDGCVADGIHDRERRRR